ncbi:MAG: sulfatase family protein [Nitrososphaera sp.]
MSRLTQVEGGFGMRVSISLCFLAVASLFMIPIPQEQEVSGLPQPNIIVIMADDLDQRSLDILLQEGLMPKLKQHVIDKGVTFSESFATYPLCCPSRATFLTGQYAHNHNVMQNVPPNGGVLKLDDTSTLATWLQDAGYHTIFIGKYLNGYGIDTSKTYIPPGWNDWQALAGNAASMYSYIINDNGILIKYGTNAGSYQTDVLATRSVEAITATESFDEIPFFAYINPSPPHEDNNNSRCLMNDPISSKTPRYIKPPRAAPRHAGLTAGVDFLDFVQPSFNEADINDKPYGVRYDPINSTHLACYDRLFHSRLESMLAVDDLIGRLFATLTANDELSRTVIVFTSDNGYMLGEHRLYSKVKSYEESIRVPLYIRIPGVTSKTIDRMVINNDLAPMFLELAGAKATITLDGRSLVPLIQNPSIPWRNAFLIETVWNSAMRTEDYIYNAYNAGGKEVYEFGNDPYELQNKAYDAFWKAKWTALEQRRTALKACEGITCQVEENRLPI